MKRTKRQRPTTCRMFETPLIERFSRIHPATPFVFWLPVLAALVAYSLWAGVAWWLVVATVAAGWLAWTLTEYLLHRYVFHFVGAEPYKRRFHFIIHGVHHDFPQDVDRLVMPLGVTIPLGLAFYLLMSMVAGPLHACPLFVGFALGYLAYDGIHYFTHHLPARGRVAKYLKRYHLVHHFTGHEAKWGVSSPLWDWVLGTMDAAPAGPPVAEQVAGEAQPSVGAEVTR